MTNPRRTPYVRPSAKPQKSGFGSFFMGLLGLAFVLAVALAVIFVVAYVAASGVAAAG